jgi:uncharacterized protein (TIGR02145 family)
MKKVFTVMALMSAVLISRGQEKFTDKRDGNVYKTLTVQGLTWMAENLRYKAKDGAYYFDDSPVNLQKYGMLYEWKTAQKVCPDGWRLPTGAEFQALVNHNEQQGSWKKKSSDPNSFGIELGGMQDFEGTFTELEEGAYFWTSTEYDKEHAEYFSYMLVVDTPVVDVSRREDIADIHGTEKVSKYSVRCVKTKK